MKQVYASRYNRMGGSYAVIVPPDIREALQLKPGDLVCLRVFGRVCFFRRLDANEVIERDRVDARWLQGGANQAASRD